MFGKKEKTDIWRLYEIGQEWNDKIKYNEQCNINEKFYNGEQWGNVESGNLPTPVINFIKNVGDFKIAYLCSSPIDILYSAKYVGTDTELENEKKIISVIDVLNSYTKKHWENCKMDVNLRRGLIKAFITGDLPGYVFWNDDITVNDGIKGDIETEVIDGTQVFFGNPNDNRINFNGRPIQPYILIKKRELVSKVKKEAEKYGVEDEIIKRIISDEEGVNKESERGKIELEKVKETEKVTTILKLYVDEDSKHIFCDKSTRNVEIYTKKDLGITLYPIAWQNWDEREKSYHGQSPITSIIPNQVFVNKSLALDMVAQMNFAYPRIVYDKNKIATVSNSIGQAIGVKGDIGSAITILDGKANAYQANTNRNETITNTKEAMGANDVLMGNIKPDNTSAIIQVTQQASIPLENQKTALYDFVEQLAYIWYDFMINKFGDVERVFLTDNEDGTTHANRFKISDIKDIPIAVKIDVGPSSMYSQLDTRTTLDNLLNSGIINKYQYIKRLPDGTIPQQSELTEDFADELGINQDKTQMYEMMSQFMETLPQEERERLLQLQEQNPDALEDEVMMLALQSAMQTVNEMGIPVNNQEEMINLAQQVQTQRMM